MEENRRLEHGGAMGYLAFLLLFALTPAQQQTLDEFKTFLAIPNLASDTAKLNRNADAIVAMFAAIDSLKSRPSVNLKFVFEGEEEAGSPHLAAYLDKYAEQLRGDVWMLCDGPVHQSRRMQLFFGARGITEIELTVYGPIKGLHDGHYGNWVPNPIVDLTHLIDSMCDTEANILIAGFYDDVLPPTPSQLAALKEIPMVDSALMTEFAVARTEGKGVTLNDQLLKPALNLRGISGGRTGA